MGDKVDTIQTNPLEWNKGDMANHLVEESSFATLFPKYREKYLRDVWPQVTRTLKTHGINCELNLVEGSMTVRTTRQTWDPYIIIKVFIFSFEKFSFYFFTSIIFSGPAFIIFFYSHNIPYFK